jgi:type I restriction enzyme M protein
MRNSDGLQSQEAFDELLKYLFFKHMNEASGPQIQTSYKLNLDGSFLNNREETVGKIRRLFSEYLNNVNSWASEIWKDRSFHLTDATLFSLHHLLKDINFNAISFDIRSTALKEFLPSEIRRGLGIYLTPDDVVRAMVNAVNPQKGSKVYDIAVGSGTFLIEVLRLWTMKDQEKKYEVWGSDKNPRMLLLADLNLGHINNGVFHRRLMDSLFDSALEQTDLHWPLPNSFDHIFTNPPFGVILENKLQDLSRFRTCKNSPGEIVKRQTSEVVFIEQSLKLLKPGGTLAIVLPKSVTTNLTLDYARRAINELGYVYAVMILPPETFQITGTQTTTAVLFMKKYEENEDRSKKIRVCLANISNVGYDSTGRTREGNQLLRVGNDIEKCVTTSQENGLCKLSAEIPKNKTLIDLSDLISGRSVIQTGKRIKDIAQVICNGKTPARSAYSKEGLFLIKVGNLTGNGINWVPRDRNFVSESEANRRQRIDTLMVQKGDILLTSSAHSPIYIAKKVDIVWQIPGWLGGQASFVGEVMLVRPKQEVIDPFVLLAFLRSPETTKEIQCMIRGQTAHLHKNDLSELPVPNKIFEPDNRLTLLSENLRREADLNEKLNELVHEQNILLNGA